MMYINYEILYKKLLITKEEYTPSHALIDLDYFYIMVERDTFMSRGSPY